MDRWKNKVAIVTGASSGIGAAISEALTNIDVIVVGLARGKDRLEEQSKKLNKRKTCFHPFVANLSKEEDILNAFRWTTTTLGPIHILVNNAALFKFASLTAGDSDSWKLIMDTNLLGVCIASREAIKNMKESQIDGHIININSETGRKVLGRAYIYGVSKHGLRAITETLRQELVAQKNKIKITSVTPGHVFTNLEISRAQEHRNPATLKSEDIADAIIYVLGTPPSVQVHELIIKPVGEVF